MPSTEKLEADCLSSYKSGLEQGLFEPKPVYCMGCPLTTNLASPNASVLKTQRSWKSAKLRAEMKSTALSSTTKTANQVNAKCGPTSEVLEMSDGCGIDRLGLIPPKSSSPTRLSADRPSTAIQPKTKSATAPRSSRKKSRGLSQSSSSAT